MDVSVASMFHDMTNRKSFQHRLNGNDIHCRLFNVDTRDTYMFGSSKAVFQIYKSSSDLILIGFVSLQPRPTHPTHAKVNTAPSFSHYTIAIESEINIISNALYFEPTVRQQDICIHTLHTIHPWLVSFDASRASSMSCCSLAIKCTIFDSTNMRCSPVTPSIHPMNSVSLISNFVSSMASDVSLSPLPCNKHTLFN